MKRDSFIYDLDLSQGIDFAIYLGMFERETRKALKGLVKPSAVVLDIGANIGLHTLLLAELVGPSGRVLSFEPTDYAIQKLRRNLSLNSRLAERVTLFHCFLAANALLRDNRPIFVLELSPYVLEERGSSLEELLTFFVPNGYRFFRERTGHQLPSGAAELRRLVRDGESMNIVARAT